MISWEYIIAALLVILVPGTGVIYTIGIALMNNFLQVVFAALGCTLSITPHLLATVFGVAAILHTSAVLFTALKLFGVIYLLYIAYCMYKDKGILELRSETKLVSNYQVFKNGFLLNVLNPKLSIFFMAFIPQFISNTSISPMLDMFVMGVFFMILTFLVFLIYGIFAAMIKNKVMQSKTILRNTQKCFALIFAVLAYKLARA